MFSFAKQLRIKRKGTSKKNMNTKSTNSWSDDDSSTDSTASSTSSSQEISRNIGMLPKHTYSPYLCGQSKSGCEEVVLDNAQAPIYENGDMGKYGYGEAEPDKKFGYGDAAPDINYGYSDAALEKKKHDAVSAEEMAKYEYGSGSPDMATSGCRKTPRRSSMKPNGSPRRRASIQFAGELQYYLPGQDEQVKRRSSIQFNEGVRVKSVPPASSLTHNPETLWFQVDEYKEIRRRSLELIEKVESGNTQGKKYCIRGLEKMMRNRRDSLQQSKYELWDAVLDEQEFQRGQGWYDDEVISEASQSRTSVFQREAFQRGKQDAEAVEGYMRSTRRMCRRLSM